MCPKPDDIYLFSIAGLLGTHTHDRTYGWSAGCWIHVGCGCIALYEHQANSFESLTCITFYLEFLLVEFSCLALAP